jgi:predicted DNA-binding transcriptional regulator YafY
MTKSRAEVCCAGSVVATGKRIYVRGYCPFREALRTFRVDCMQDVMVMQAGRYLAVDDVEAYFAAYAAGRTEESARPLLNAWND